MGHEIAVDTNGFEGEYYVYEKGGSKPTKPYVGPSDSIDLEAGNCTFHIPGGIAGNDFSFDISSEGRIENITPSVCAEVVEEHGRDKLVLKTRPLTIAAGGYEGEFRTNLQPSLVNQTFPSASGERTFTAIVGMRFYIQNPIGYSGKIVPNNVSAVLNDQDDVVDVIPKHAATGGTLQFGLNTVRVGLYPMPGETLDVPVSHPRPQRRSMPLSEGYTRSSLSRRRAPKPESAWCPIKRRSLQANCDGIAQKKRPGDLPGRWAF